MSRVLVGMSGGVDSSTAAALLLDQGHEVEGVTLRLYKNDVSSASAAADKLGIRHWTVDLSDEFRENVIDPFASGYENGITPNPCIICNKQIKFGSMLRYAQKKGFDYIATGHYARIIKSDSGLELHKAKDREKDQTYFLYTLTQDILKQVLFPLGDYTKPEIREIAKKKKLASADKKDSQDICFVEDNDYSGFLIKECGASFAGGVFLDPKGKKIGRHKGMIFYTIGQRKGLGAAFGKKMYVTAKNVSDNTVTLGSDDDLFSDTVYLRGVNIISGRIPEEPTIVEAKIRYNQEVSPAVYNTDDSLRFQHKQRAVTPGQSAVFYQGEKLIGGGVIILK